jgi:hypothetical protein
MRPGAEVFRAGFQGRQEPFQHRAGGRLAAVASTLVKICDDEGIFRRCGGFPVPGASGVLHQLFECEPVANPGLVAAAPAGELVTAAPVWQHRGTSPRAGPTEQPIKIFPGVLAVRFISRGEHEARIVTAESERI